MFLLLQGLKAIYSPATGIVDYSEVTKSFAKNFEEQNGTVHCNFEVKGFIESTDNPDFPVTILNTGSVSTYVLICSEKQLTASTLLYFRGYLKSVLSTNNLTFILETGQEYGNIETLCYIRQFVLIAKCLFTISEITLRPCKS